MFTKSGSHFLAISTKKESVSFQRHYKLKMLFLLFIVISPALSMFAAKPSETGVDVVTCKMNKNTDKKDDVS